MKQLLLSVALFAMLLSSFATFAQQADTPSSIVPLMKEEYPSVVNMGSAGFQSLWLHFYGAYAECEWPISNLWTLGGQVGGGRPFGTLSVNRRSEISYVAQVEGRARNYFGHKWRKRKGYTLRSNSGFFTELAVGLAAVGLNYKEPVSNPTAFRRGGLIALYGQMSLGFQYATPWHLFVSLKFGYAVTPPYYFFIFRWRILPIGELKLGYAF